MPIGVPKVAYRLPGDSMTQWVDLYNRLYRERILFLGSDLDDELANQLVGLMIYLSAEDSSQNIFLYINSPGGSVSSGLALYDIFHHVDATIHTICVGLAASMASLVLAGGEYGVRLAFPHARIMMHQPSGGSSGQASDILKEVHEVIRLRFRVGQIYSKVTGMDLHHVSRDLDRDFFLSAREALNYGEYGLVDQISEAGSMFTLGANYQDQLYPASDTTGSTSSPEKPDSDLLPV